MSLPEIVAELKKGLRRYYLYAAMGQMWEAYALAKRAISDQAGRAESIVRERWNLAPDETPPPSSGGSASPDFADEVLSLELAGEESLAEIRRAFLIAIFHTFERYVNRSMRKQRYDHDEVVAFLIANGNPPDESALMLLATAANAAKHGPGTSLTRLVAMRPDLVDKDGEVTISDAQLEQMTRCVRELGLATAT